MKKNPKVLLGAVVTAIGCGIFLYPNFREWRTQQQVDAIIEEFQESSNMAPSATPTPIAGTDADGASHAEGQDDGTTESGTLETASSALDDGASQAEAEEAQPSAEPESSQAAGSSTAATEATESAENASAETAVTVTQPASEKASAAGFSELYQAMEAYNLDLSENGQDIVDAWSYEQTPAELPGLDQDNPVIGYISIPDMDLRLPLYIGASEDNLEKGAAVLSETSMPVGGTDTNCVIAAHRGWQGSAYFQYIENLGPGSKVYITTPWETLTYEFSYTQVIDPDDVSSILIQPGKDMVTLYTCHPYQVGGGPYRYLVFCERSEGGDSPSSSSTSVSSDTGADDAEDDGIVRNATAENAEPSTAAETAAAQETGSSGTPASPALTGAAASAGAESGGDAVLAEEESGVDYLALEQTLRVMLPIAAILAGGTLAFIRLPARTGRGRHTRKKRRRRKTAPAAYAHKRKKGMGRKSQDKDNES